MLSMACVLLLSPLSQGPDLLTALLRCEVRGAAAFSAAQIHDALTTDAVVLQALTDHDDAGALADAAAARVRDGYLHAGFAAAEVDAAVRDGALRLEIREGARLTCGSARFAGNTAVPSAELLAALQQGAEDSRWTEAAPAPMDRHSLAAMAEKVRECYLRRGRHGAQCRVAYTPKDGEAWLHIEVTDEGQEVRVGRLELVGERPDDLAAVLQRVPFQEGALYDQTFAEELRLRIEGLGRHEHVVLPRGEHALGGRLDPFRVHVKVAAFAPSAAATRWDDLAQVQRGLGWLQQQLRQGRAVRVAFTPAAGQSAEVFGHRLACARVVLHLAADGIAVAGDDLRWDDQLVASPRLVFRRDEVLLAVLPQHHGWARSPGEFPAKVGISFEVEGDHMTTRFSAGFKSGDGARFDLALHPATGTYLLQHPDLLWQHDGSDLVAQSRSDESEVLRIGTDGNLGFCAAIVLDECRFDVALCAGDLGPVSQALRPSTGKSLPPLDELAALVAAGAGELLARLPGDLQPAMALTRATARYIAGREARPQAPPTEVPFHIPGPPSRRAASLAMPLLAASLANRLRATGWLQTLLEALPALQLDDAHRRTAARRVFDLAQAPETGPLARALIAAELRFAGFPGPAAQVRESALQTCEFEPMWRDTMALAEALSARQELRALGAFWRQQPELQDLFGDLQGDDADDAALQRGFGRLWDAGLGGLLRRMLQADK